MPHIIMGPAGAPPPPPPNEVKLLAENMRLSNQLDECHEQVGRLLLKLGAAQAELATLGGDLHWATYRLHKAAELIRSAGIALPADLLKPRRVRQCQGDQ